MSRSFEESRQMASDNLSEMERRLAIMTRTHNRYLNHGAVNAAAELQAEMESLERDIGFEQEVERLTFY